MVTMVAMLANRSFDGILDLTAEVSLNTKTNIAPSRTR